MKIDQLKRASSARVWKGGRLAASLVRDPAGITFDYEPDYAGPDVATSLPRRAPPVRLHGGALPPFFSGLLPEGRRLSALRRAAKTSADDELTLLLAVGCDTVGDVQVTPAVEPLADAGADDVGRPLAEVDFVELFAEVLAPVPADRVGLAGVQDKVSGRMISLPLRYANAAWILKLDPPDVPFLVENEAFFIEAARRSGLDVVDAEVVRDRIGRPGLLVPRFDRVPGGEGLQSLAVEDACQALGRYPADKYRLTTEQVIEGLAGLTGAPVVAARALLSQFAFAYLTCNGDAHGKNFSVVRRGREWRIAPAYDLPSSQPYGDTTMALTLNGKDRQNIGRRDFIAVGERCGVARRATERVLDQLLLTMPVWLDQLDRLPFDERRIHRLRRACGYRADRLRG